LEYMYIATLLYPAKKCDQHRRYTGMLNCVEPCKNHVTLS